MYEVPVFMLCANQTVPLQLVMNVLQWIVLSHYRVRNCCLSVCLLFVCNLILLGYDRV